MRMRDRRNVLKQIPDKKGYEKVGYILDIGPIYRKKSSARLKTKSPQEEKHQIIHEEESE